MNLNNIFGVTSITIKSRSRSSFVTVASTRFICVLFFAWIPKEIVFFSLEKCKRKQPNDCKCLLWLWEKLFFSLSVALIPPAFYPNMFEWKLNTHTQSGETKVRGSRSKTGFENPHFRRSFKRDRFWLEGRGKISSNVNEFDDKSFYAETLNGFHLFTTSYFGL